MAKYKNYKLIYSLFLLIGVFWLTSCNKYSKEEYFFEFEQFANKVESEYTQYDKNKWKETELEYDDFNNELYDKVYPELNPEDQNHIGKLKARYQKVKYEYEIKNTIQSIKDGIQQTVGAIEQVLDSTTINY